MIQQIAEQVANDYDRHPNELKKKRYSHLTNINDMKQAFVKQCVEAGYQLEPIAEYMEHSVSTVSEIFTRSDGKRMSKADKFLEELQTNGTIQVSQLSDYNTIAELRRRGHCIANIAKYTYKLI